MATPTTSGEQSGTIAVVTGANKGLGRETARRLALLGMTVFASARDERRGRRTVEELRTHGADVRFVQLDVTDEDSVLRAAYIIEKECGGLDVLVNNAGAVADRPAFDVSLAEMRKTFDVNVCGIVAVTNALLPLLRKSTAPRIVNVTSHLASLRLNTEGTMFGDTSNRLDYSASKAALNMLTVQYARLFRRDETLAHIKINAAAPGYMATDLSHHQGTRTVEEGARIVVQLATLGNDGPCGRFFRDEGELPW